MTRPARLLLAVTALSAGCAAHRPRGPLKVTAAVVRTGAQCGGEASGPSARWITTEGALRAAMGAGGVFGAEVTSPPLDFAREGVLAVYMGQRPTAGYGLALHDPTVAVADGVGTLVVRFEAPEPGAMVLQVITSPCLLVRLPREGLREVRVVDPTGSVRAVAALRARPSDPAGPGRPAR